MNNRDYAARVVVIEKAIVTLAALVEQLRQDLLDEETSDVVDSSHEPKTMD